MDRIARILIALCLTAPLGLSGAEPVPAPALAPATVEGPRLTGRWGLGFDNIPGASAGSNLVPGLATANAASIRYWINESLAWDGLLSLNMSSQPTGGAGAAGVPAGTDQRGYGVGTVMKWNARRPTPWLLAQVLGRASLASLSQLQNDGSGNGQTTTTFGLGLGVGFEAFFPLWDSLSVEGSIGLNFSSSQTKLEGGPQVAQSGSSLDISGTGFSPLNVAVHLYF